MQRKDIYSTSLVVAQMLWVVIGTIGATTKPLLANDVTETIGSSKHQRGNLNHVNYIIARIKIQKQKRDRTRMLSSIDDWHLIVDNDPSEVPQPQRWNITQAGSDIALRQYETMYYLETV